MFKTPQSYPEMISIIAKYVGFVAGIEILVLSNLLVDFKHFLDSISFNVAYTIPQTNISVSIAIIYLPVIFAFIERVFKFHDKVS